MSKNIEFKNCPFCASSVNLITMEDEDEFGFFTSHSLACTNEFCGAVTTFSMGKTLSKRAVAARWNKREHDDAEGLKDLLEIK